MRVCAVCKAKYPKGTGNLFRVPKNEFYRARWAEICGTNFTANSRVCQKHFLHSSIVNVGGTSNLLPNAEPFVSSCVNTFTESEEAILIDNDISFASIEPLEYKCKDIGVQTENNTIDVETQTEMDYFERILALESENKNLKLQLAQANKAVESIRSIFTDGQIRRIMAPGRVQWKWPDISNAICLHAAGPRAYNHLYVKGFPLPHRSTLQRWCAKVDISEVVLSSSIDFMRHTNDLAPEDKICVLAFDEMKVAETYEYDPLSDSVKKPANYVQVAMARGLRKSWKQPVFYDFDCKMTPKLLNDIIRQLHNVSFTVVGIVCDMGPSNRKLVKELGVTKDKPWFPSPVCSDNKIFAFADAPHLLKLVRNHFIDSGIYFEGTHLSSRTFEDLLSLTTTSDTSIAFKVNYEHLTVKGRQKVSLAAQLFSHTTANAIRRCYSLGFDIYNPTKTADFVQLTNDWFDVLNSKLSTFKYPGKEPYGLALENQKQVLLKMNEIMSSPIIPGRKNLEPFQIGIIMTNNALMMLLDDVGKYNMEYIITNRLNQDVLENFFGAIRSKGGLNDHPSPMDFKYRLRKYILAKNTEHLNGKGNVEDDSTEWLNSSLEIPQRVQEGEIQVMEDCVENAADTEEEEDFGDLDETKLDDIGILQEDALEYVSGYIIKKLNLEEYQSHTDSFTWVDQVSKGSLKKPNEAFLREIKKLEIIFEKINGNEISHQQNLRQYLIEHSNCVDLPENIKRLFFKCRIFFRIRNLNKRLSTQKRKQNALGFKKFVKIKL